MVNSADKHVETHVKSLIKTDMTRFMELIEGIQYGLAYLIIGFLAGTLLDYSFPNHDENTPVKTVLVEALLQCILLIVLVFYVRKLVKIMPSLFDIHFGFTKKGKYKAYSASEYGGELMISLAVIGAQFHLIKKLDFLSRKFYKWIFDEERELKHRFHIQF